MSLTEPLRVGIVTIGCRANAADSQGLAELLQAGGVEVAPAGEDAALYVVNTCTVTHRADADARATVRRLHRQHPTAPIVVTGCAAQVAQKTLRGLPGVVAVVGNAERATLPEVLAEHLPRSPGPPLVFPAVEPVALRPADAIRRLPAERSRPLLKVQDGCDRACAYCIVPRARGPARSLHPDAVVDAATRYAQLGAEEIVLSGVHLGLYGRDPGAPLGLAGLLDRLDGAFDAPDVPRFRLSSLEPDEVDEALLAVLRRPRFCRHVHLPLQSGDDAILKAMRRPYGSHDVAATVAAIRRSLPSAALGADVIVGFPGETEESFERTVAFLGGLDLTYLHVFSYSQRPGTPAAELPSPVPPAVRKARSTRLRALGEGWRAAFHRAQGGRRARVLVESPRRSVGGQRGLTGNFVSVTIEGPRAPEGRLIGAVLDVGTDGRVVARWNEADGREER